MLWNSITQGVVRKLSWHIFANLVLSGSTKIHLKKLSCSWLIGNDITSYFRNLLLLVPVNPQPIILSIWVRMWCCDYSCVHIFILSIVVNLCWCSLQKLNYRYTFLWTGATITVVIPHLRLHDQGVQSEVWFVFYYGCNITMVLYEARMYCSMHSIIYLLLSFFLMVSESPRYVKPCGFSKAFLSTAFGLRLSLDYFSALFVKIIRFCRTYCRTISEQFTMIDMYFNENN
uniref:Uncharacterized protein n=1 Tax=Opuntia streptacantha TaxID=393608 RepID=A0A7C9DXE0_OPUST